MNFLIRIKKNTDNLLSTFWLLQIVQHTQNIPKYSYIDLQNHIRFCPWFCKVLSPSHFYIYGEIVIFSIIPMNDTWIKVVMPSTSLAFVPTFMSAIRVIHMFFIPSPQNLLSIWPISHRVYIFPVWAQSIFLLTRCPLTSVLILIIDLKINKTWKTHQKIWSTLVT